jgi:hypothetical protein
MLINIVGVSLQTIRIGKEAQDISSYSCQINVQTVNKARD